MMSSNWEDVAQRSHQSRREARESQLREESRQLELEEIKRSDHKTSTITEYIESEALVLLTERHDHRPGVIFY